MPRIAVYYDENTKKILTEDELIEAADECVLSNETHIDIMKRYDRFELWEMLRPEIQNEIMLNARDEYIEENCVSRVIDV